MAQPSDIGELADRIDPRKAQLFAARVLQILGSAPTWGADQVSFIDELAVQTKLRPDEVPSWSDQSRAALDFWNNL